MKSIRHLATACGLLLTASWAASSAASAQEDSEALVTFAVMKPEVAVELAEAAMEHCRAEGAQIAVAVVDRFGNLQVLLRDRFAGPHTPETKGSIVGGVGVSGAPGGELDDACARAGIDAVAADLAF